MVSKTTVIIAIVGAALLAFAIGIVIGFFSVPQDRCIGNAKESSSTSNRLIDSISASNIEDNLR